MEKKETNCFLIYFKLFKKFNETLKTIEFKIGEIINNVRNGNKHKTLLPMAVFT